MKKLLSFLTLGLFVAIGFATNVQAAGEIELYPYDKIECLQALDTCTNYKVGDSDWDLVYNGYRYNFVNGNVRYADEFTDDADDLFDPTEIAVLGWNGFASLTLNNTASEVVLDTANDRTDLTTVVHRIYAYFDETGTLQMFEDHYVTKYHIFNDGTVAAPDWRLATQAEADAYDLAVTNETAIPATTMYTTIRLALSDTDTDGYVLEPLTSLKWEAQGVDKTTAPVADWSSIIAGDPNDVVIPAGWTVMTFSSLDRDGTNAKTVDFLKTLVGAMTAATPGVATVEYTDQPAYFTGLTALDDDSVNDGVQMVVEYLGDFDLSNTVTSSWLNMFDDTTSAIINSTEEIDYSVVIAKDGVDLETIDFTWDGAAYTASAAVTVIDSSKLFDVYTATYTSETPEGDVTEVETEIVVGFVPPFFVDVEDRYANEGLMVDLLGDVTADDGYGMDLTDTIMISYPENFNPYNPQPGEYEIDLEFTLHVHFDGTPYGDLTVDGTVRPWDGEVNEATAINTAGKIMVYTDADVFADAGTAYAVVMVVVGADGKVDEIYDRYDWDHTTSTGTVEEDATLFAAWQAAVEIEEGGFIVAGYGSTLGGPLRDENLAYDAPVTAVFAVPDYDYDLVTEDSYMLTIDDTTAPTLVVVNYDKYQIEVGEYASANTAILANVVAFDNVDERADLSVYVSDNGVLKPGVVGIYTVEVTAEDEAGNSTSETFFVEVVPAPLTADEVQAMLDLMDVYTQDEIDALIAGQDLLTEADVQAMIDDIPVATGCGSAISGVSALFVTVTAILGATVLFVSRKRS